MHNAMIAGDRKNGVTPRPEWYYRALSIIHDLEAAGREPGAVRAGSVMAHLSFPGDPHGAVFLGSFPIFSEVQSIDRQP
jgi:hypothetical protein